MKSWPTRRRKLIKGHPAVRRHLSTFAKLRLRMAQRKARPTLKGTAAKLRNLRRSNQRFRK